MFLPRTAASLTAPWRQVKVCDKDFLDVTGSDSHEEDDSLYRPGYSEVHQELLTAV